jgi:hypothetical protein
MAPGYSDLEERLRMRIFEFKLHNRRTLRKFTPEVLSNVQKERTSLPETADQQDK